MNPHVSVVIPHLNQPALLARCLASLMQGTLQPDEIIVVDNGSNQLPTEACTGYPGIHLLQELTSGPAPARNCGVAALVAGAALQMKDAVTLAPARSSLLAMSEVRGP